MLLNYPVVTGLKEDESIVVAPVSVSPLEISSIGPVDNDNIHKSTGLKYNNTTFAMVERIIKNNNLCLIRMNNRDAYLVNMSQLDAASLWNKVMSGIHGKVSLTPDHILDALSASQRVEIFGGKEDAAST